MKNLFVVQNGLSSPSDTDSDQDSLLSLQELRYEWCFLFKTLLHVNLNVNDTGFQSYTKLTMKITCLLH